MDQARIYAASRASIPARSLMWRRLRELGYPIISTWIDEAGENETDDFGLLWSATSARTSMADGITKLNVNEGQTWFIHLKKMAEDSKDEKAIQAMRIVSELVRVAASSNVLIERSHLYSVVRNHPKVDLRIVGMGKRSGAELDESLRKLDPETLQNL